jgi:O-antigen/teichoic acid export membrane protein
MIHQIGVSDYGLYSLIGTFLGYFMLDFGLAGTITRFVAKYRAEGDETKVANMLGLTARVYLVMDAIIFAIVFILYFFLTDIFGGGLTQEELETLKVLYCIAGTFSVLSFLFKPVSGAMMAYEYFVENKLLDLVVRVGTVVFIIIMLLLGGNVYHLVFITGLVGFLAALIRYTIFIRKSKLKINWSYFEKAELIGLFSFSVWVLVIQLSQMFRLSLIPTILGIFNNTTEISIFSVGKNLEGMVFTISAALNGLFLPMVSRMVQSSDRKGIMELMMRVGRIQLFIILLIFSGFVVFGQAFVYLWVGETFNASYYVFLLLVFVNILSLTMQIGMDMVYAENKIKQPALRVLISSAIGLVLSILLAPKYGAIGCAAATGFALVLTQILYVDFYKNNLDLDMGCFFKNCHLKIMPLIVVYAVVAYFICRNLSIDSWLILFVVIGVYTVGYLAISLFFLTNDYEKSLILGIIKKRKS